MVTVSAEITKFIEAANIADSAANKLKQAAIITNLFGRTENTASLSTAAETTTHVSIMLNNAIKFEKCNSANAVVVKIAKNKVSDAIKHADIAKIKEVMDLIETYRRKFAEAKNFEALKKIDMLMSNSVDANGCSKCYEASNLINVTQLVESAVFDLIKVGEILN